MLQEERGMPLRRYLRSGILEMLESRRVLELNYLRKFWMGRWRTKSFEISDVRDTRYRGTGHRLLKRKRREIMGCQLRCVHVRACAHAGGVILVNLLQLESVKNFWWIRKWQSCAQFSKAKGDWEIPVSVWEFWCSRNVVSRRDPVAN